MTPDKTSEETKADPSHGQRRVRGAGRRVTAAALAGSVVHISRMPVGNGKYAPSTFEAKWPPRGDHAARMASKKAARAAR